MEARPGSGPQAGQPSEDGEARITPGGPRQIGRLNYAIARVIGAVTGGDPPHVFTTLARHRRLFRPWLRFAGALMPGGALPRADTELVILRVAHSTGCEYEWGHHERLAQASGLSQAEVARVREGPAAAGWTERQRLLLEAADELLGERTVGDPLWRELSTWFTEVELIELCMLVGHYEMLAMTLNALRVQPDVEPVGGPARGRLAGRLGRRGRASSQTSPGGDSVRGRRVLITGAARGIGALLARRLHSRGADVALLGIEPELLSAVAADCGKAPWIECDVRDRDSVEAAVAEAVAALGGLDVAVANAGIGGQMTLLGGDPAVWDATLGVNLEGTYNLIRAAGPHVAHPGGYFLVTASLAAALHLPLMAPYCASKAAVESLGDSLRMELAPTGARVGVAYYAELDTDMTARGFATEAAQRLPVGGHGRLPVAPVEPAIDALERGIAKRSRRISSPRWVAAMLPARMAAQRLVERQARGRLREAMQVARSERPPLTTEQPEIEREAAP